MLQYKFFFSLLCVLIAMVGFSQNTAIKPENKAPQILIFEKFADFEAQIIDHFDDKIRVVNFWATWCKPCVKELPYFNQLFIEHGIDVILVSLDKSQDLVSKLQKFIDKNNISTQVVALTDSDANSWIDKVDPAWQGSIPATIIMSHNKKLFFEREFESTEEILDIIKNLNQ